jgi:hypothetical protein
MGIDAGDGSAEHAHSRGGVRSCGPMNEVHVTAAGVEADADESGYQFRVGGDDTDIGG